MAKKKTRAPKRPDPNYVADIVQRLKDAHPDAHCELNYETPLQLLLATILSAQCTDVRVNKTTPALFEKYPDVKAFAEADITDLEEMVRPTGFYRMKAQRLQESCRRILTEFDGEVPDSMDALLSLAGVARKTANVVLGEIFNKAEGVVVDTHVKRLANKFGFTTHQDPVKIEKDLMAIIPQEDWVKISHILIFHGRRICSARKPDCAACTLNDICPASEVDVLSL